MSTIASNSLTLIEFNKQIAQMEQQGEAPRAVFEKHLSDHLVFRRASGNIVTKSGPEGFRRTHPLFSSSGDKWLLELWYNYEITHPQ